jgi:hypothetical protein
VAVVGPFWIVALTLLVSGAVKVTDPAPLVPALGRLHLPARRWAARLVGLIEVGLGAAAIAAGGTITAGALAVWYVLLAVAAGLLLRAGAASCGCFGAKSAPPSIIHVLLDLLAAVVAVAAAAMAAPGAVEVVDELGFATLALVGFVGLGTTLLVAAFELLTAVLSEPRPDVPEFDLRSP